MFEDSFCSKCANDTWDPETDRGKKCAILGRMYLHGIKEKGYPTELRYYEGQPTCTAFELPKPYKKPEPKIPGQLTF